MRPVRGEVWLFDLLKAGAFVVQNVSTYPHVRAIRRLGVLKPDQFRLVFAGVLRWLGQDPIHEP